VESAPRALRNILGRSEWTVLMNGLKSGFGSSKNVSSQLQKQLEGGSYYSYGFEVAPPHGGPGYRSTNQLLFALNGSMANNKLYRFYPNISADYQIIRANSAQSHLQIGVKSL